MATTTLITAEDVERLPEDDRFELIRGERREVSPTSGDHGSLQIALGAALFQHVKSGALGRVYTETGYLISRQPDTLVAPDISFVRSARLLPRDQHNRFLRQAPDLAVEILSPGDRTSESLEKVRVYLDAGVSLVWIVDPKRQRVVIWKDDQTVHELKPGDILDGGNLLPGFRFPVADLFPD